MELVNVSKLNKTGIYFALFLLNFPEYKGFLRNVVMHIAGSQAVSEGQGNW
jgi:hypothetical protein